MARAQYDQALAHLREELIVMGEKVGDLLDNTLTTLKKRDKTLAPKVVSSDAQIDAYQMHIENQCTSLIIRQQPIAADLRVISSALKMVTDLERVGDQCKDICEIVLTMDSGANGSTLSHIVQMMEMARSMYARSLEAYATQNVELAKETAEADDEVDRAFSRITLEVCSNVAADTKNVMRDVDLLFITKYIERIADHATNIAEWVIYMVTGVHPVLNS